MVQNLQSNFFLSIQSIRISSTYLDNGKPYNDLYVVAHFPETFGLPEILDVQCKSKGTGPVACRMLLSSDNAALILMQQGKFELTRTGMCERISKIRCNLQERQSGFEKKHWLTSWLLK